MILHILSHVQLSNQPSGKVSLTLADGQSLEFSPNLFRVTENNLWKAQLPVPTVLQITSQGNLTPQYKIRVMWNAGPGTKMRDEVTITSTSDRVIQGANGHATFTLVVMPV